MNENLKVHVTIYIRDNCRFCDRAQSLLQTKLCGKQIHLDIINASHDPQVRTQMIEKSGGRNTFPQIFINNLPIGGCDDLYALEAAGRLDALLQGGCA